MKKLLITLSGLLAITACATTVLFPLQLMTGNKHNRTILIQPDISTNQLVNGTNLVGLLPVTVTPTNGVGRAALLPWSYTVRVDGWPKSFHILVPDSTNTLNAVDLITNTVAIGTPVQLLTSVAVSNSATVTWTGNGTSTNPLIATATGGFTNGGGILSGWLTNSSFSATGTNAVKSIVTGMGAVKNGDSPTLNEIIASKLTLDSRLYINDGAGELFAEANGVAGRFTVNGYIQGSVFQGSGSGLTGIPTSALVREVRWVDALASGGSVIPSGVSAPTKTDLAGGWTVAAQGYLYANGNFSSWSIQSPHVLASTNADFPSFYIEPHIHISPNGALTGGTNATFVLEFEGAAPFGVLTNSHYCLTNTFAFTNVWQHGILSFGNLTNNVFAGHASVIWRGNVRRLQPAGNTSSGIFVDSVDFHVPIRSTGYGSTSQYTGE